MFSFQTKDLQGMANSLPGKYFAFNKGKAVKRDANTSFIHPTIPVV